MPLVKQALSGTTAGVRPRARPLLTCSFKILAAAPTHRNNPALSENGWKLFRIPDEGLKAMSFATAAQSNFARKLLLPRDRSGSQGS